VAEVVHWPSPPDICPTGTQAVTRRKIYFSPVDKRWTSGASGELAPSQGRPTKTPATSGRFARYSKLNKGWSVMRGDNITVGSKSTTSKPDSDSRDPVGKKRPDVSGAMSQQRCDSGNPSTPQKFVRLVGCHDPRIKPQPKS
jgi:hypothetical protein